MQAKRRYLAMPLVLLLAATAAAFAAEVESREARGLSGLTGVHRMPATVIDFDRETGIVDLKTSVGELKVHFPPAALKGLKKGDAVQLQLGLRKAKANE